MTDKNFVLRSGKYAGKTLGWLEQNQVGYLNWVKENRPEMLKNFEVKAKPMVEMKKKSNNSKMEPNMNFWNEGPDPMSIPYLIKMQEQERNNLEENNL